MVRFAFTMMELIFVIIIIGVLAALAMPSFHRDPLYEAATQIVNHIRYTQHLAMVDDKYNDNNLTWYKEKWQIRFRRSSGSSGYVIFSDKNQLRNVDPDEPAIDPSSGIRMDGFNQYKIADLTNTYNIKGDDNGIRQNCLTQDGSKVSSNRGVFAFDQLGRPYTGLSNAIYPTQYLMKTDCNLILTDKDNKTITITVRAETGYACIINDAGVCQ
ncbi:MAG: prepilin-type N-terminal cleavage/methylation domain-containing protein [Sulfuricurvum sp.]|nr:prepilin-type N-terminal cleavage/methylation domain-containing protein [Sulfuricurvum sp.]